MKTDISNNQSCCVCKRKGTFSVAFQAKEEGTLSWFYRIVCPDCFYEGIKDILSVDKYEVQLRIYRL